MIDYFVIGLWLAVFLDLLLGDPRWLPHPIRLIGSLCGYSEKTFRSLIKSERLAGIGAVFMVLGATVGVLVSMFYALSLFSAALSSFVAVVLLYTSIALRDLAGHASVVRSALAGEGTDRLDLARQKVGMMVGRDPSVLDEQGVVRACVESVAENMSDGVIAPLFWAFGSAMVVGEGIWALPVAAGAAMVYKAVNTMDSMFGYKNERYLYFGRFAARLDDVVNYLPARLTSLFIILAAPFVGASIRGAFAITQRDHHRHASPNAGYPEAAMAGALGVRLGGANVYFGKMVQKPNIGDENRGLTFEDIEFANRLMYGASILAVALFSICAILTRG
ncbi:MAG: adenosylcobinamide-phosphate synthase CbiB [Desulfobulbaceae bacterium]|nr:adenosylcobinamide-phosphate synthase CbiB [Desulfobulbaceae bacterium]